jgi:hypothetical protein
MKLISKLANEIRAINVTSNCRTATTFYARDLEDVKEYRKFSLAKKGL